jgi:ABC-type Fe3+ transport system permease subunit
MEKKKLFIPWGIFSGISLMLLSYAVVGLVGVKVVSHLMIVNSGGDDGLGSGWWNDALIAGIVVFTLMFIGFLVLYILRERKTKQIKGE